MDVDVGVVLYEMMPDGSLFHLSYYLGRASHAQDMGTPLLLTPGVPASLPLRSATLVSRQLNPGSRLLVVLDVNKNPFHQVNYGTGGDVSDESIADAGVPLVVEWSSESYLDIPLTR